MATRRLMANTVWRMAREWAKTHNEPRPAF
jgi:hypothetical protein